jgi:hypothetical protein
VTGPKRCSVKFSRERGAISAPICPDMTTAADQREARRSARCERVSRMSDARVPALGRLGGFSERQLLDALDATGFRVVATDRLGPIGLDLLVVAVKNDDA